MPPVTVALRIRALLAVFESSCPTAVIPEVMAAVVFLLAWLAQSHEPELKRLPSCRGSRGRPCLPRHPCAAELHVEGQEVL